MNCPYCEHGETKVIDTRVAGKGTIRFSLTRPVPVRLIGRIAKLRAREVADKKKARALKQR